MSVTRKGIWYDLSVAPYRIEVEDYIFCFSSAKGAARFEREYKEYEKMFEYSFEYHTKYRVKFKLAPALRLYANIEKRGFRVEKPTGGIIKSLDELQFLEVLENEYNF